MTHGPTPSGWRTMLIGDIATVRGGSAFPEHYQGEKHGDYPFYKVSDMNLLGNETWMISANNYISKKVLQNLRAKPFPPQTIIFPKVGAAVYTNKKRILSREALIDNNVMGVSIESKEICDAVFLYYWFKSINISDFSNPGALPSITGQRIKDVLIPVPPLPEQHAIACALRAIQEAKEARQQELMLERERKSALMQYLFAHGTRGEARKQTESGEIPESWQLIKLGEIASIVSGGTPERSRADYWGGDIDWVKTGEINYNIITEVGERITAEGLSNSSARIIPKGTLLMAMYGQGVTRGRVAILGIDAAINQACAALQLVEGNSVEFLFYFLAYNYDRIRNLGHGANQRNLNSALIRSILITLPHSEEQAEIANVLRACDSKIAALEKESDLLEELFKAMLEELMTGRLSAMPLIELKELETSTAHT
jgi:type I restriction enzyme, S subunit